MIKTLDSSSCGQFAALCAALCALATPKVPVIAESMVMRCFRPDVRGIAQAVVSFPTSVR